MFSNVIVLCQCYSIVIAPDIELFLVRNAKMQSNLFLPGLDQLFSWNTMYMQQCLHVKDEVI